MITLKVDIERFPKLTEGLVQRGLAAYVDWLRCVAVPNLTIWHEMDLAVLTRAGCLYEYEIKLTQADWNGDKRKDVVVETDWHRQMAALGPEYAARHAPRPIRNLNHVERFYYVYAKGLTCPDWVPEWAGLISVDYKAQNGAMWLDFHSVRRAKSRRVEKPSEGAVRKIYMAAYMRFWNYAMNLPLSRQVEVIESPVPEYEEAQHG
mgnify:FL=1